MEDVGMGRAESTGTFEARLNETIATAAAVEGKLKAALRAADAADDEIEAERRRLEEEEQAFEEEWEIKFSGCYFDYVREEESKAEESRLDPWQLRAEMILQRKIHKGRLYYKVLWRKVNCVSWELEENVDDKQLIFDFEKMYERIYNPATSRVRPARYITRRQLAALSKEDREAQLKRIDEARAAAALSGVPVDPSIAAMETALRASAAVPSSSDDAARAAAAAGAAGCQVIWSCEVEPSIWVPYDDAGQRALETAYRDPLRKNAIVVIAGREYIIGFSTMRQNLGNVEPAGVAVGRRVQRVVQLPEEEERRRMMAMSLDELRAHIATIQDFQPVHYEMLTRLHELDQVKSHATAAQLDAALHKTTFERVMNEIMDGFEFPGFTTECFSCLEDFVGDSQLALLCCGHFFHLKCAVDYFSQYSKLCPVCKSAIC